MPGSLEAVLAHRMSGITFWFQGDYASAREHLEQAFATHDHERDRHLASRFGYYSGPTTALWLAQVLWPLGHVARATHMAEQGLRLALETGHIPTLAQTHYLACVLAAVGRKPDRVMWHAEALISLAREHALPLWLAHGTFLVGWARCRAGDRTGEAGMRNGLAMLHDMDVRLRQPLYGTLLAEHEAEAGDVEAALVTLGAQLAMIKQTGERWFHAKVHQVGGKLLTRQPSKALDAEVALNRAIEIARSQQTRTFELCAALSLAKLYQTTGRSEAARELLAPAVVGFSEGPELPEVAEANRLLASLEQRFGAA